MDQPPEALALLGKTLQDRRLEKKLTLEAASVATRIKLYYLEAIEAGHFELLPSTTQAKGFVRTYAGYLGLEPEPLLAALGSTRFAPSAPQAAQSQLDPASLPPAAVENSAQAAAIFTELGRTLRSQREQLSLSIEDVERHTYLREHYLKAMESGDFEKLPSPVQGRGMVSNYAAFLGLDPDQMLNRYAEALQAQLQGRQALAIAEEKAARKAVRARRSSEEKPRKPFRFLSLDALIAVVLVLFLGGFVVWGGLRISSMRNSAAEATVTATAPSIADVILGASTGTPTIEPTANISGTLSLPEAATVGLTTTPEGTVTPDRPVSFGAAVQVYIVVRQRAWVRVTVDGEIVFDDRVLPGSAYQFDAEERIEILTGSGSALQVFYNQVDQGVLGNLGQIVQRVYTVEGALTPTPAVPPTSIDETARPQLTPTPGGDPTMTPTP